jgi:hypothetical protein
MSENEILTGADIDAMLADSVDVTEIDDSLRGVIARTAEVLVPLAVHFDPSIGNHGFFDIYRIGYGDAEILIAAGLVDSPAYTNARKLTQAGAALFARRA